MKKKQAPSRRFSRNFNLNDKIDKIIDELAKRRDMTRSQIIRALVTIEWEREPILKSNRS